jgi:hypothetical protein
VSRPGTRISRFYEKIDQESGYYDRIAEEAAEKWRRNAEMIGESALEKTIESLGRVISHRARLTDKINLYKTLISDAIGADEGGLSDHDAVLILAGWAREHWVVRRQDSWEAYHSEDGEG